MEFEDELNRVLPADLPHRENVVHGSARHLTLIVEANKYLNLTRITSPREAAIKHVLDSVIPWRLFLGVRHVLDAGTGAGFPGIPLALVLPETRFTLAESIQKKARFVESVLGELKLPNVEIAPRRAEELTAGVITARALAPIPRVLSLFRPALKAGASILLYKGPDAEQEIAEAETAARKIRAHIEVVMRYDLPDALGTRKIVQIAEMTVGQDGILRGVGNPAVRTSTKPKADCQSAPHQIRTCSRSFIFVTRASGSVGLV